MKPAQTVADTEQNVAASTDQTANPESWDEEDTEYNVAIPTEKEKKEKEEEEKKIRDKKYEEMLAAERKKIAAGRDKDGNPYTFENIEDPKFREAVRQSWNERVSEVQPQKSITDEDKIVRRIQEENAFEKVYTELSEEHKPLFKKKYDAFRKSLSAEEALTDAKAIVDNLRRSEREINEGQRTHRIENFPEKKEEHTKSEKKYIESLPKYCNPKNRVELPI